MTNKNIHNLLHKIPRLRRSRDDNVADSNSWGFCIELRVWLTALKFSRISEVTQEKAGLAF
jgi:hypothetical protein